ncbi:transcription elongation factor Spt5 [Methanobacterium aggregans]|uniref:transcription elongation factor Spt5 n=1 Tax=Methanobacterium aggregans TaxID=1615586 RepID=UPI001AE47D55|nr:transcription elongation factor Spt5 [Methanobacterium aggregans]MBP2045591.1 transcriptional antiterminator NusG [Methanobacterium aggregans]
MIYAIRTLVGQEKNVARIIARNVKTSGIEVYSILVPETLRGYILIESETKIDMQNPAFKVPHMKGAIEGEIPYDEIQTFLNPEPITASIKKGSIVELVSGPFKGEKAKVIRIDESKEDVVLELIEAAVPIPVTVKGDQIRLIQKEAD